MSVLFLQTLSLPKAIPASNRNSGHGRKWFKDGVRNKLELFSMKVQRKSISMNRELSRSNFEVSSSIEVEEVSERWLLQILQVLRFKSFV